MMTEANLQKAIVDTARLHGWLVHHDPPIEDRRGRHRTAIAGDSGFPDLVLARDGETIIVECKAESGRYQPGQREWLRALGARVVKPSTAHWLLVRLMEPRPKPPPPRGTIGG